MAGKIAGLPGTRVVFFLCRCHLFCAHGSRWLDWGCHARVSASLPGGAVVHFALDSQISVTV